MPKVTIDDRTIEVERGTNLVDAATEAGVQIPHYCYHPRLSVVGQCRMCLVQIDGMPKLQAGCSTQVMKDGMVVRTDSPEVREAQKGMMEFFLINHPLDCPICDQAGECGLQDYAFKHGQAFSRFQYEDKRTYPGRERIPLGPNVVLNMNRCIQCTRCVRFTREVSQTGELGFFNRGARTEIGTFPGKPLDGPLASNVVDICPVGALTSTRFRFAERVWYLDKRPSLCTGCDVGCNVTLEHRRGQIRRYKPRANPEVNDFWMCDYGRSSFERYYELPRLAAPRVRRDDRVVPASWSHALEAVHQALAGGGRTAILGSGNLTTEEAWLLARLAEAAGPAAGTQAGETPAVELPLAVEQGPRWTIPNPSGGITGSGDTTPNRRGAELAGFSTAAAEGLLTGTATGYDVLFVADSDFGSPAHDEAAVERLRGTARFLVVMGWAETPLARAADVVLPVATHAEREGTFVNVEHRLQRFETAFPPPAQVRPATDALTDLLAFWDEGWRGARVADVFARMAAAVPALAGIEFEELPAQGVALATGGAVGAGAGPSGGSATVHTAEPPAGA
ncbi:MAG TPA: molybdopterin-dependent oxidoreductase [Thermoanaerobaculia bacterium]|nr:molybdopterin-dependent oxidoreductase [Thermoanaerobaculia bacterium]